MSVDYAAGLSDYDDLGVCNLDEVFDTDGALERKVARLAEMVRLASGSCVIHVGAGLSTSAGIRDFRGKGGVWSEMLEARAAASSNIPSRVAKRDEEVVKSEAGSEPKPEGTQLEARMTAFQAKPFDQTEPTAGHMALKALCQAGLIRHIVSQNVDGLFLKANLERKFVSELHGNFYLDECTRCRSRFIRSTASQSMRLQRSNLRCFRNKNAPEPVCKGYLRDTILDWESPVPYNELRVAERESKRCKLHICIGTSLQLKPSRDLIVRAKQLVVINLQPTHMDSNADLVINYYSDQVLLQLVKSLQLQAEQYDPCKDPTKQPDLIGTLWRK